MSTLLRDRIQKMTVALLVVFLLFLCLNLQAQAASIETVEVRSAPLDAGSITRDGMVRVYLASLGNPTKLDLTIRGDYRLSAGGKRFTDGSKLRVGFSASTGELTVSYSGQSYSLGRSFSLLRSSSSGTNGILIAQSRESGNPYPGDLSFEAVYNGTGYTLYTIAHVYIENYLYGVLPYEMGNASGIEALKAQAVAARTYTVRMMVNRASNRYDVKDTTSDQVYRGTPTGNANCRAAVDATKGIVLMHGEEYITTYYSASNGGQTEIARTGTAYPYMKVKDDPFDYANPSSTVKKKTIYANLANAANPNALTDLLESRAVSALQRSGYPATPENTQLGTLKNITPHTPMYASPSRVYTKMDFSFSVSTRNSAWETVTVPLTETFSIFGELESMLALSIQSTANELWSVEKTADSFEIQARRYGHGMGLSQRGAMYMSKLGYTYDQILGFYYDGCKRVRHSFTNTILTTDSGNQEIAVESPAELENDTSHSCTGTVILANNKASLAIRASASHSAKLIGYASNGAIVDVIAHSGAWYQIHFGEITGFVPSSALSVAGTPDGELQPVTNILGFAAVKASDFVNLRESGSMKARVVGTAPAGAVVTVFSRSGQWARVQYNALAAYVNINYISEISSTYPTEGLSNGVQYATIAPPSGKDRVELRETASTGGKMVAELAAGTTVKVLSDDGAWCHVAYDQIQAYIQTEFLRYVDSDVSVEEDETEEEGIPETNVDVQTAIVATEQGSLNLRALPASESRILTTIPKGTEIDVTLRGEIWSGVEYRGYDGYVMTRYLRFATEGSSDIPPVTDPESYTTATVVTSSGSLNLRNAPRSDGDILARIPRYAVVKVYERGHEWSFVEYAGMRGYAMSSFLAFDGGEASQPPANEGGTEDAEQGTEGLQTAYVHTQSGSLNMRREPSLSGGFITAIPRNAAVTVIAYGDEWCAVRYYGHEGYVMRSYLRFENQQEQTEPESVPVQPSEPPASAEGTVMWVATSGGSLNMRSASEDNAAVVTTIPQHAQVTVFENIADWSHVSYKGYKGFVKTRYLSSNKPSADAMQSETDMYVTAGGVTLDVTLELPGAAAMATTAVQTPIYTMCIEDGQPIISIPQGEKVEVLLIGELWCRVDYQGEQGYCLRDKLDIKYEW